MSCARILPSGFTSTCRTQFITGGHPLHLGQLLAAASSYATSHTLVDLGVQNPATNRTNPSLKLASNSTLSPITWRHVSLGRNVS